MGPGRGNSRKVTEGPVGAATRFEVDAVFAGRSQQRPVTLPRAVPSQPDQDGGRQPGLGGPGKKALVRRTYSA